VPVDETKPPFLPSSPRRGARSGNRQMRGWVLPVPDEGGRARAAVHVRRWTEGGRRGEEAEEEKKNGRTGKRRREGREERGGGTRRGRRRGRRETEREREREREGERERERERERKGEEGEEEDEEEDQGVSQPDHKVKRAFRSAQRGTHLSTQGAGERGRLA